MGFSTDALVADLQAALREGSPETATKRVVEEAVADEAAVVAALGEPTRGGINPLYVSDDLTVLNVIWSPGMALYPHEHRMVACIGIYGGREDNAFYRRGPEGKGLVPSGGKSIEDGDVVLLGSDVIHAIVNPLDRKFTGAIHVYHGNFFEQERSEWTDGTADAVEQPRDLERTARTFAEAQRRWEEAQA